MFLAIPTFITDFGAIATPTLAIIAALYRAANWVVGRYESGRAEDRAHGDESRRQLAEHLGGKLDIVNTNLHEHMVEDERQFREHRERLNEHERRIAGAEGSIQTIHTVLGRGDRPDP